VAGAAAGILSAKDALAIDILPDELTSVNSNAEGQLPISTLEKIVMHMRMIYGGKI